MSWVNLNDVYVNKTGDTITGNLAVNGTLTANGALTVKKDSATYNVANEISTLRDSVSQMCLKKHVTLTSDGIEYVWHCFKSGDNWTWSLVIAPAINPGKTETWIPLPYEDTNGGIGSWDGYSVQITMMSNQGTNIDYFNKISYITSNYQSYGFTFSTWSDYSLRLDYRFAITVTVFD